MTVAPGELFQRALLVLQRGELGAAEQLLKEAIELQPTHRPALNVLSTFLASPGRLARRSIRRTVRSPPMMRSCKSHPTWLKPRSAEGSCTALVGQTLIMDQERRTHSQKSF
jgi:hypothetical protein